MCAWRGEKLGKERVRIQRSFQAPPVGFLCLNILFAHQIGEVYSSLRMESLGFTELRFNTGEIGKLVCHSEGGWCVQFADRKV